jgi:hypothetical protein
MSNIREIKEGEQEQGVEEEITYTLTVPATWGVPSGTPTVKGYSFNESTEAYTDVTSTIFPTGSASIASQVITLPECKAMTADVLYRVEVKFDTSGGGVMEPYAWIRCRR